MKYIISLLILISLIGCGKETHTGFKLINTKQLKALKATSYTYEHIKTGGKVVYIDDGASEKSFGIVFKTPAVDDSGVNHVFEHTVLQGSKKYPDKNLFYRMNSKNISSYLNAATGPDYTVYPFSAVEEKSFDNILDIYLAGVFSPMVLNNEKLLKREGWRYDRNPNNGELIINGIVYNEMKGTYSNSFNNVLFKLNKLMYSDENVSYKFSPAGLPSKIPNVNLDQLRKTHKNYYNPSNSIAILSGKMNIEKKLIKLDEYYSKFEKKSIAKIVYQKTKLNNKFYTEEYPASKEAQSIYSYGILMEPKTSISELSFINSLLLNYETSPLQKIFNKHRFSGILEPDLYENEQPRNTIFIFGVEKEEISDIKKVLENEIKKISEKGIDPDLLNLAFKDLKKQSLSAQYSKTRAEELSLKVARGYFYYGKPNLFISDDSLKHIEKLIKNPEQIKKLIKKYYIDNENKIEVLFNPNDNLFNQIAATEKKKLKNFEENLDKKGLNRLNKGIENFNIWVKEPVDKEIIASLPKIDVKNLVNSKIPIVERDEKIIDGVKFIKNNINTYGINLVSLKFDTTGFTRDEKMELELFSILINAGSTPNYTSLDLSNVLSKYFFKFRLKNNAIVLKNDVLREYTLNYEYLPEDSEIVYSILEDFLLMGEFDDKLGIRKRLENLRESILNASSDPNVIERVSIIKSVNMINPNYTYYLDSDIELGNGENYYVYPPMIDKINDILSDFDNNFPKLQADMRRIRKKIFNKNNLTVFYAETSDNLKGDIKPLLDKLPNVPIKKIDYAKKENYKLAIKVPAQNGSSSWGNNLLNMGYEYNGKYEIMSYMINDYLNKKIRIENGAYGAYFSISSNKDLVAFSYRDGEIDKTIDIYRKIPDYLETQENISQKKLNGYILQGMARYYHPYTPDELLKRSYNFYINNINLKKLEKEKIEMLSVTNADIVTFKDIMEKFIENKFYSTVNNTNLIEEKGNNTKYDKVIKFEEIK